MCQIPVFPGVLMSSFLLAQDDEGIPAELRGLPEYKELLELKRLKKQKLSELQEDEAGVQHVGYKVSSLTTGLTL